MLNQVYQLIKPNHFAIQYKHVPARTNRVLVKPHYMAICHADQRYFQGKRDAKILSQKLPMALIHEASGIVLADPTGTFNIGQSVVMIPNQPPYYDADKEGIYENYLTGGRFLSSTDDGFMQEVVSLPPHRLVAYQDTPHEIAVLAEFMSVAMHAVTRFEQVAHEKRDDIVIIGDGSLSFMLATALKALYPHINLTVIGRNEEKLSLFYFADATYLSHNIPSDIQFDHGFECAGGQGSEPAINDLIKFLSPQGTIVLMGVSENPVAINTRDILEKGLTLVGSSRSGRVDFEKAVQVLSDPIIQNRLKSIVYSGKQVNSLEDIYHIFAEDLTNPFKTVFKWNV